MVPAMTKPNIKQFDIVSDHSDHHYSNDEKQGKNKRNNSEDCFINSDSTVYKAIMREWNILENNLPDTIYVRAYETRVDLMRAAIVGAAGTPYHDALFVFDIKFPPDYPNRPPHVHYWSYEWCRPNPCLRRTGGVRMSLLNTLTLWTLWTTGWGKERWVSSQSTILQVLESIQMLVLNEEPLFNDMKDKLFDKIFSTNSSIAYNTEAFIETCKSTVYLLRHPPKNFEGIIADHYRSKACDVLRAYIAYANGRMRVGHYNNNEIDVAMAAENNSRYCNLSDLERRDMEKLYPLLVQEFEKIGFSAEDWVREDLFSEEMIMEPFLVVMGRFFSDCLSQCLRPCPCLPCLPGAANDDDDRDQPLLAIKKTS